MNNFKRELNEQLGQRPRFNESLKQSILLKVKEGNKPNRAVGRGFGAFKYAAIFVLLLSFATLFLFQTLTDSGQVSQPPAAPQQESPVGTGSDTGADDSEGQNWEESPLFISNDYTMIGEEGRAGFIYDDDEITRFYEDRVQKYMWHFWGSKEELTGTFKVMGTHENSGEEIVVVPEGGGNFLSPNNGADHHIPTLMTLPQKGMWKLEAVFNDQVLGTVFVEVHEKQKE